MLWVLCISTVISYGVALDNGLALTPPMGWMSWLRFGCHVNCTKYPKDCLTEDLIKRTADRMVSDGYRDAGYEYVIIDDCWLEEKRSADGRLVPDRERFPSGMKALSDYIHSKGLKFGIYQDIGTKTCAGYPGLRGHEQTDVDTFVEWEVDYIKVDGCNANPAEFKTLYPAFGKLLNESGRPIVYSCSWPAYMGDKADYKAIAKSCNLWRNTWDISASWKSVLGIMDWFGKRPKLADYAGPGHFNDPDMLIAGNKGASELAVLNQMSVWTMLAAPLLISADLDEITEPEKQILLDPSSIEIARDPLGEAGQRVYQHNNTDFWMRPLHNGYVMSMIGRNISNKFKVISLGIHMNDTHFVVKGVLSSDSGRQTFEFPTELSQKPLL